MSGFDSRKPLLLGSATAMVLVTLGWATHREISALSAAAAFAVLALYSLVAFLVAPRLLPRGSFAAKWAVVGGLAAGSVFCTEICLEYVVLPVDNSRFGEVEFGTVWLIYFAVGTVVAISGEKLVSSLAAAGAASMISSLLWCICLLAVFYAFEGSARQSSVLLAEGDFEDFRRSGMASFRLFEMEDLFGATFFHLLLGPLIAVILAATGWLTVRIKRSLMNRTARR